MLAIATPMRDRPPTYPFMNQSCQRAIVRQKTCDPPTFWRIPSRLAFRFSRVPRRLAAASVRHRHVPASVRGYLRSRPGTRKSKKCLRHENFALRRKTRKIWWLAQQTPQRTRRRGNFLAGAAGPDRVQAEARRVTEAFGTSRSARSASARTT